MQMQGQATRVTLYIGESDHYNGQSLYVAILEFLRKEGAAGATVTRGLAGFGAHSRIHTATIETLSVDLPVRIEWIDLPERVERLLPAVRRMVNDGLIISEQVAVIQYSVGRSQDPLAQPVHDIMREEIVSAPADLPVARVMGLLLERNVRSLPIVADDGRLLGIITDGDLLRRAQLTTRLNLQKALSVAQIQHQFAELEAQPQQAADVMTQPVITVKASDPVRLAAARMTEHHLKRLPVIDETGRLVGLVSRIDVLRALEYHHNGQTAQDEAPQTGDTVTALMYTDVPSVGPQARLEEIIQALEATQRRRVVVVDEQRHVLGIITDGDLLRRSRQPDQQGLLSRLRNLIAGPQTAAVAFPDATETAAELMTTPVITITVNTPLTTALHLMLQHQIKRLPVVDPNGCLVGLLGRSSLLNGLLKTTGNHDASQPA